MCIKVNLTKKYLEVSSSLFTQSENQIRNYLILYKTLYGLPPTLENLKGNNENFPQNSRNFESMLEKGKINCKEIIRKIRFLSLINSAKKALTIRFHCKRSFIHVFLLHEQTLPSIHRKKYFKNTFTESRGKMKHELEKSGNFEKCMIITSF